MSRFMTSAGRPVSPGLLYCVAMGPDRLKVIKEESESELIPGTDCLHDGVLTAPPPPLL